MANETAPEWVRRIGEHAEDWEARGDTTKIGEKILAALVKEWDAMVADPATAQGYGFQQKPRRSPPGTSATVERHARAHLMKPPSERRPFQRCRWPESFGGTDLPLEAAGAVLRLMSTGRSRPSIRQAEWAWKIAAACPDVPTDILAAGSRELAALEASGRLKDDREALLAAEYGMAYRAWTRDGRVAYDARRAEDPVIPFWNALDGIASVLNSRLTDAGREELFGLEAGRFGEIERLAVTVEKGEGA